MNSTVLEKIKKLLSLANSDNQNERDLALAKAQRIAVENQIDLALVDLSDVGVIKEEAMIEDEVNVGKRLDVRRKFVAAIVKDACKVEVLYGYRWSAETGRTRSICFLGTVSDVAFAKWLYSYLLDEYQRRWDYERKANDLPASHRNTFFLGLRDGQRHRLEEERRVAQEQAINRHAQAAVAAETAHTSDAGSPTVTVEAKTEQFTQKFALAVQNETAKRRSFLKQKYPRLGRSSYTNVSVRSHDTYASGTSHGRSIGLSRPLAA